ncbi:MAG TPA: hypothetical protein VMT66_09980 [Steroidobacteraceae bacterium]|nr:hypothetical protein [Steroidobacteraceae bacterium]
MVKWNRRGLLQMAGSLGFGAYAVTRGGDAAAAAAEPSWQSKPAADGSLRFFMDVAVLGHTDAQNTAGRIGDPKRFLDTDARGDNFYVEGNLYPGGTIPAPTTATGMPAFPQAPPRLNNEVVWDFKPAEPLGHWLCRGWVLFNGSTTPYKDSKGTVIDTTRMQPRLLSEQTFVFGRFDAAHLSPDMLLTSGPENGLDPDTDRVVRAVVGGTGRFKAARGEVTQTRIGRNTSALRSLSAIGVGAPNFHFAFDIKVG